MKPVKKLFVLFLALIGSVVSLKATIWTVTTLADSGPGSLRDTVTLSSPGDTIQFAVTGTILLSSSISIPFTLNVLGPGASWLTINAGGVDRAFITGGNPVFLSGMVIENGLVVGAPGIPGSVGHSGTPGGDAYGGAILDNSNSVSLILSNIWFNSNSVQGGNGGRGGDNPASSAFTPGNGGGGGAASGGALYATGSVTIINCTFSANSATGGNGGSGGTNFNLDPLPGGLAGDSGPAGGGAVYDTAPVAISFENCTFAHNLATGGSGGNGGSSITAPGGPGGNCPPIQGGAIAISSASFYCDTIVSNTAIAGTAGLGGLGAPPGLNGVSGGGIGGGIFGSTTSCSSHIGNTIIVQNHVSTIGSNTNYYFGFTDDGYNFFQYTQYVCSSIASTTQAGSPASPNDAKLLPLAQYGGGIPTCGPLLMPPSPVIDQGYSFGLATDERGAPRPYSLGLPRPPGGDGSDIGAFEIGSTDLGMSMTSNNVVLSWPAYYGDFAVQFASSLRGSNNWNYLGVAPVQVGNRLVVTNPVTNAIMFYRLINK